MKLVFFILSSLFIPNAATADPIPPVKPTTEFSNPNACAKNDPVCAERKLKELQKAAVEHEKNMEKLKIQALVIRPLEQI